MCTRSSRTGRLTVATVVGGLLLALSQTSARAAEHPLFQSTIDYLPMPQGGEWSFIAVSNDGSRVYLADAWSRIVAINTSTDTVAATIQLPDDAYIGGIGCAPNGRLFVSTREHFIEIDPNTHTVLSSINVPGSSWEGEIAIAPDSNTAYTASGEEIHVISLAGGQISYVDTTPGDTTVDGLVAANPGWGSDYHRAWRIAMSSDGNRLYARGDTIADPNGGASLHVIDGLAGGTVTTPLTLSVYTVPIPAHASSSMKMVLSDDGSLLFDSFGNVWRTSDMQILYAVALGQWTPFGTHMLARPSLGTYIYYQGFATLCCRQNRTSPGGEQILVASGFDYKLIDLDGNSANGLTGIGLPGASGWNSGGAYNAHEMVITPDGRKLYIAGGSSGAPVVKLSFDQTSILVKPNVGGDDGQVTVRVLGKFESGTTAALSRSGQADITGTDTTLMADGKLQTRFDLTQKALGKYDLVLTPPSGPARTIKDAFTVEAARVSASVDLPMAAWISAATAYEVRIPVYCDNTGNVDLTNLIVTLGLPEGTQYKLELPSAVFGGKSQTDPNLTTAKTGTPEYVWIGRLIPGETYRFWLTISGPMDKPPSQWDISLDVRAGFVQSSKDAPTKVSGRQGAIGDLCTLTNSIVKSLDRELAKRGHNIPPDEMDEVVGKVITDTLWDFGVSKLSSMVAKALGELAVRALVPQAMPIWNVVFGTVSDLKSCFDLFKTLLGINVLVPSDPNIKVCNTGVNGYITAAPTLRYVIHFENTAQATAPAKDIVITDQLDGNLDLSTFKLSDSSDPNVLSYTLDTASRTLTFTFTDINLPPNASPPEGQGWVTFAIGLKQGLASGTTIRNKASIVFDRENPIQTPEVAHTIDTDSPNSAVTALPDTTTEPNIPVKWSGTDSGVGIWDYTIYASVNDGNYATWLTNTTQTSGTYIAKTGEKCRFYSMARDRLGNTEAAPSQPDAVTSVVQSTDGAAGGCCGSSPAATLLLGIGWMGLTARRRRLTNRAPG